MDKKFILFNWDWSYRDATKGEVEKWVRINAENNRKFIYNFKTFDIINLAEVDSARLIALYCEKKNYASMTSFEKIVKYLSIGIFIFVLFVLFYVNWISKTVNWIKTTIIEIESDMKYQAENMKKVNNVENIKKK